MARAGIHSAADACTAHVVGMVINLVACFAWYVLWSKAIGTAPFAGRFELFSLLITVAAFVAPWRLKFCSSP